MEMLQGRSRRIARSVPFMGVMMVLAHNLLIRLPSPAALCHPLSGLWRFPSASWQSRGIAPFPISDLGQVLAVLLDVLFMLDEFVLHDLLQVRALRSKLRYAIDHILHKVKAIQFVLHANVEGCGDRAFLLVSADVEVSIRPPVGEPMHQRGVAVKTKNDVLILGKE